MGTSIDWFIVNAKSIGNYWDKWNRLESIETRLYDKYKEKMDSDMERLDKEMEDVYSNKKDIKDVKDFSLHRIVSFEEFDEWFDAFREKESAKSSARLIELPQLYMSHEFWVIQWILNRYRDRLELNPKSNLLKPKNDDWNFVLTQEDLTDLIDRMTKVSDNPELAHQMFPIYDDLYFGAMRKEFCNDASLIITGSRHFAQHLKYAKDNILRDPSIFDENALMMEICL